MALTRQQLGRMIDAGRTSALDCITMIKDIRAETDGIRNDDPIGVLFANPFLNDCIFLKTIEARYTEGGVAYDINDMMYFPYNFENVYEGGDSVFLSDDGLKAKIAGKFGADPASASFGEKFEKDRDIFRLMSSLPTFDPFLFKCRAQQMSLEDRIHPSFFNVNEKEWNVLQRKIRGKIRKLVEKAFEGDADVSNTLIEKQVTVFLNKIWEAQDIDGIEDLVKGLGIPYDKAPELFFAWKAVCYYQTKYEYVKPELKQLFGWFGGKRTALPSDFSTLSREEQSAVSGTKNALRQRLRENFRNIEKILSDYEASYDNFIDNGNPEDFKKFLGKADILCNSLAGGLAAFSHAINIYRKVTSIWGSRLQFRQHTEVLESFTNIFGSGGAAAAPAEAPDEAAEAALTA